MESSYTYRKMFSFHPFCFLPKHSPIVLGLVQGPLKRPKKTSATAYSLVALLIQQIVDTFPYKYNGYEVVAVCRKHSPISQNRKILLFLRTFLKRLDIRDLDPLDFSLYCNRFPKFTKYMHSQYVPVEIFFISLSIFRSPSRMAISRS